MAVNLASSQPRIIFTTSWQSASTIAYSRRRLGRWLDVGDGGSEGPAGNPVAGRGGADGSGVSTKGTSGGVCVKATFLFLLEFRALCTRIVVSTTQTVNKPVVANSQRTEGPSEVGGAPAATGRGSSSVMVDWRRTWDAARGLRDLKLQG